MMWYDWYYLKLLVLLSNMLLVYFIVKKKTRHNDHIKIKRERKQTQKKGKKT